MRRLTAASCPLPVFVAGFLCTLSGAALHAQCYERIENPSGSNHFGGEAVEIDGARAAISSSNETWIYELDGRAWSRIGRVPARGARISGERVVTGARGSVPRVWVRDGDAWVYETSLSAPGTGSSYGQYYAISFPYAAVSEHDASRVDVFEHDGVTWSWVTTLRGDRLFGWTIDMDADRLVVGKPADTGEVDVYRRNHAEWELEQRILQPADGACIFFGTDVSISGGTIAVGTAPDYSRAENVRAAGVEVGAACAIRRPVVRHRRRGVESRDHGLTGSVHGREELDELGTRRREDLVRDVIHPEARGRGPRERTDIREDLSERSGGQVH